MRTIVVEGIPHLLQEFDPANERDFEAQVLRSIPTAFAGFRCAPWKPLIRSRSGFAARPDAVMVASDIEDWYVLEVELSRHPIDHISNQLDTLGDGVYDRTLLPSLTEALPSSESLALRRLVERPPGFLCVVNSYSEPVQIVCRSSPFDLVVAEPFRSSAGDYALAFTQIPATLRVIDPGPATYVLRRGNSFGDTEWAQLPSSLPRWSGPVELILPTGQSIRAQIVEDRLLLPVNAATPNRVLALRVIDPKQPLLKLEVLDGD